VKGIAWPKRDEEMLRRLHAQGLSDAEIGRRMQRSASSIKARRGVLGCVVDRAWKQAEIDQALALHGKQTTVQIAALLGRSLSSTYQLFFRHGLTEPKSSQAEREALIKFIAKHHAQQWSDSEIAAAWSAKHPDRAVGRQWIRDVRCQKLGLPKNGVTTDRFRRRVAAKTQEQLEKAGLPSMGHLRREAFKAFCVRQGWPQVDRPRLAQILNLLYEQGPHTREQISAKIGVKWQGTENHPASRMGLKIGTGASAMSVLMKLGLVVRLRRTFCTGKGKGQCCFMYAIAPGVVRGKTASSTAGVPARKVT
jgi:DnaJ-domain-containing protein 1